MTTRRSRPRCRASVSRPARRRSGATPTCCRASPRGAVDLGAGFTPLLRADRLGAELGLSELWLKNDTVNPTGSFKDRVVSVALTGRASSVSRWPPVPRPGNLANSVAAHAARAGMKSVVCIPADLETPKVVTTAVFGGLVVALTGNYDEVNRLCAELASEHPTWAFVNVNVRSYYAEGSKTLAFEVAEQLGWTAPDHVVVPIASGCQLTKVAKGFRELYEVGLLRRRATRAHIGCAGDRLFSGGGRVRVGRRLHPAGEADRDRQVAGHRQPS